MNREINFKETVELFVNTIIYDIVNEVEIPRINFIFNSDAYNLFYDIMKNPFELKKGWTPDIKEEDINFLKNSIDYKYPSIYIKDHIKFFTYLTDITNSSIKLYNKYNESKLSRQHLMHILRRIWLRMSPSDFNNIEEFLKRQLLFIKTDIFEELKFKSCKDENTIDIFNNNKINATNSINRTWDESTKSMIFRIKTDNIEHTLPNILYDIIENTCYIYALQNEAKSNKNKEIEKQIYKIYRGNSQPNKVYALKLFISMLKEKGIKNIKVPTLQVLDYDYHKILSKKEKESFENLWTKKSIENLDHWEQMQYEKDLLWYNHIVDKEDIISKIKTEDLINLIYRIVKEDNDLDITNDIDISDTLDIKIKCLKV